MTWKSKNLRCSKNQAFAVRWLGGYIHPVYTVTLFKNYKKVQTFKNLGRSEAKKIVLGQIKCDAKLIYQKRDACTLMRNEKDLNVVRARKEWEKSYKYGEKW